LSLTKYIKKPKDEWTDQDWLEVSYVMVHSPWISKQERKDWRDKIKELNK